MVERFRFSDFKFENVVDDYLVWLSHRRNIYSDTGRELQRIIKVIVNLQPYDISNITKQIITGTRDKLKEVQPSEISTIIKDMVYGQVLK